jgi:hypothetical protein
MIRFIDITRGYYAMGPDEPLDWSEGIGVRRIAIFVETVCDSILSSDTGSLMTSMVDVCALPEAYAERCIGLVPVGFFSDDARVKP